MKLAEEPEERMEAVGKELLSPPAEVEALMELLGRAESLLAKVEQSPQPAMLKALEPVMKGLVSVILLKHQNRDVKVAVAACISEITRITAPEAPYDDELMKAIFELIVEAFGGLTESSQSSQISYRRRLSILETVAKVRSCVVMLDLECDELILQMFRHFFQARRITHPDSSYALMETIMVVVVEESEDFSSDLICCLLDSVKKDNEDASRELGESVIGKCGAKLKQYLLREIQASGVPLGHYSRIVASVCNTRSEIDESNDLNACRQEDDSKLSERTVSEELQQRTAKIDAEAASLKKGVPTGGDKSSEPARSNGVPPTDKDGSATASLPQSVHDDQALCDSRGKDASGTGKTDRMESLGGKVSKVSRQGVKKSKSRKDNSSVQLAEMSDRSPMDVDKDVEPSNNKNNISSPHEVALDKKHAADIVSDDAEATEPKLSKEPSKKTGADSDGSRPRRGRPTGSRTSAKKVKNESVSSPSTKIESSAVNEEVKPAKASTKNVKATGSRGSGGKLLKSPDNQGHDEAEDNEPLSDVDLKDDHQTTDVLIKSGKQVDKEVDRKEDELQKESQVRKGRQRKSSISTDKPEDKKDVHSEAMVSPEIIGSDPEKDQDAFDEASAKKSRRKRVQGINEDSSDPNEMLGQGIEVWWPDDKKFYTGVVESYDPVSKKHKVLYEDGDVEHLVLSDEKWRPVKSGKSVNTEPDDSPTPAKKKVKVNSNSTSKKANDGPGKRGGSVGKGDSKRGVASLKSADDEDVDVDAPQSSNKQDKTGKKAKEKSTNKPKAEIPNKGETPESVEVGNSKKDKTPKSGKEAKVESVSKSGKKSKDTNQESDAKAKDVASTSGKTGKKSIDAAGDSKGSESGRKNKGGRTPKSAIKSPLNGNTESTPKAQETEDPSPKNPESSRKRGRPTKG